jgi:ATP-dependent DNA ligase
MKERPKREGIMLAYPVEDGRLSRLGDHFIIQPKINGERCKIEWFADEPVLISSYGNEFKFMEHIKDALKKVARYLGPVPFDGEIYTHGWGREEIDSALRRKVNRSSATEGLNYHIFDVRSSEKAYIRQGFLYDLFKEDRIGITDSPLKLVPSAVVSKDDWMHYASEFISNGYEGAILRKIDSPWEPKRTVSMLKFKPTEVENYAILEVNEAIDKYGVPKSMVGSFLVQSKSNEEPFKVGAGKMPHNIRSELWRMRHTLTGRYLRVKHEQLKTSGGVPLCSVAVGLSQEG